MRLEKDIYIIIIVFGLGLSLPSCAIFGSGERDQSKLIEDPFGEFHDDVKARHTGYLLRTKKGNQTVELELPRSTDHMTDFVVPLDGNRSPASTEPKKSEFDSSYVDQKPGHTDREIALGFPKGRPENEWKRHEVESQLGLRPSEDVAPESETSYLGGVDKIKQLFKLGRYEAALLESDKLLQAYPTDPKLYEMRGTLLDRLGYNKMAIEAWEQAMKFDPGNRSLKKYLEKKQNMHRYSRGVAGQ